MSITHSNTDLLRKWSRAEPQGANWPWALILARRKSREKPKILAIWSPRPTSWHSAVRLRNAISPELTLCLSTQQLLQHTAWWLAEGEWGGCPANELSHPVPTEAYFVGLMRLMFMKMSKLWLSWQFYMTHPKQHQSRQKGMNSLLGNPAGSTTNCHVHVCQQKPWSRRICHSTKDPTKGMFRSMMTHSYNGVVCTPYELCSGRVFIGTGNAHEA